MDRRLTAYVLKYLLEHRFESMTITPEDSGRVDADAATDAMASGDAAQTAGSASA